MNWEKEMISPKNTKLQFTLVTEGKIVMQVNGIDYELDAGQAIFINKGVLHITTNITPYSQYVSFNFPEKLLGFFANSTMENNYVLPFTNSLFLSLLMTI
ncbi:cupin domain-containing protein [Paenibacillus macerans]|uniref:cupin domain-containing protein n=1 Tax=Paenibacillus macerans TaxID=44252 RepID=UPI0020C0DC1E|nr:cupin domain-containing protein [Paenibacillus macerans]MDU5948696.1 cupin domain-containing protein [Paenibacillus macerans]